jgi:hypothetical protein
MSEECSVPKGVSTSLQYFNDAFQNLEDAFIKPEGMVYKSPFVRYVTQLASQLPSDGKMTPLVMNKGFNYYLLDLHAQPKTDGTNYYFQRHVFGKTELFGSLTAVSHSVPALFAVKELSNQENAVANLNYIKTALAQLQGNSGSVADWGKDAAWSHENSAKIKDYIDHTVNTLARYVNDWSDKGVIADGWDDFLSEIYKPMINTFFMVLLSEAKALFDLMDEWKKDDRFNWERTICAIGFTTDNPLSGKPTSDLSLATCAEYYLMRAFLIQNFGISDSEITVKDNYAEFAGTSSEIPERIFSFATAVPGYTSFTCPANPVDNTEGDTVAPNSVLLGSSPMSSYWATLAQRKVADGLFPNIENMGESDAGAKGFYDLLRRPQYGLRYTFVKAIAAYYIENGTVENMPCPYPEKLW